MIRFVKGVPNWVLLRVERSWWSLLDRQVDMQVFEHINRPVVHNARVVKAIPGHVHFLLDLGTKELRR